MSKTLILAALLSAAVAMPVSAQKPAPTKAEKAETKMQEKKMEKAEEMKKLQAEAKVSEATARATALAKVPAGSTVAAEELEREHGKLLYSYDMKVPGKTGIDEVQVNAMTGAIVGKVMHESPKAEKKEAKAEKKEAMKKTGH